MIVLIPARGGSKGLPEKNIKLLCGKPLIAYSIEAALRSNYITDVFVSTDCQEIKKIAESYGAKVPFLRPNNLATDESLAIDTYLHFVEFYENVKGLKLESLLILLPTAPLRNENHIDEALNLFYTKKADSVVSFAKEHHPISWHKVLDYEFRIIDHDIELKNRQQEFVTYFPNGSIFIFKTELLKQYKYYSKNSFAYLMDRNFSIDIDSIDDFEYAEYLISKYGL